jgi:hypothetical protein
MVGAVPSSGIAGFASQCCTLKQCLSNDFLCSLGIASFLGIETRIKHNLFTGFVQVSAWILL